jgi:uroporphyrinogen-III decarboxylase
VPVQAWSAFGFDALVWMTGVQGAIYLAMDDPGAFRLLLDQITETDLARTKLAASYPGVDMVVERGWYSSTEFWSPRLLDQYLFPHISILAGAAHEQNKPFGYVMTTGIDKLGKRLIDSGVDVLYFLDPHKDTITLEKALDRLGGQITLVGGVSSLTLDAPKQEIEQNTVKAMEILGKTNRFILHPVDSIYPNTPWEGLNTMIETWRCFHEGG